MFIDIANLYCVVRYSAPFVLNIYIINISTILNTLLCGGKYKKQGYMKVCKEGTEN